MTAMTDRPIMSRRAWLSLAGASVLLARDAGNGRVARADEARPMRLVILMQANGVSQQRFWPDASGTSPIGVAASSWRYDWLGIGTNSHDNIAHKDDGMTPVVTEQLTTIGRWHAEHVARLALALDALPSGSGNGRTALDDTLIVWSNELATGQHSLVDIPVTLIGGGAGRVKPAGGLVDVGPQTYHRLGCTMLNAMGATSAGFGEEPSCGVLHGVTLAT